VSAQPAGAATSPTCGSLADIVDRSADRHPDKLALIDGDRALTYRELAIWIDRVATNLATRLPGSGERVGILLPNSLEFAVALFATLRAGHVALPLSTAYTAGELAHQVSDGAARLVITDTEHAAVATTAVQSARISGAEVVVADGDWDGLDSAPPEVAGRIGPTRGDDDLALLLYTSGTSGLPKGAMLSHRALLANQDQLAAIDPVIVSEDDVALLVLPLYHVYGLNAGLCLALRNGATGVLARDFDPVATLRLVRERRVTALIGAPPMYVAWAMLPDLRNALASVRLAVSGAAPLPPTVQADIRSATGRDVYQGYGLTETAPVLTTTLCSVSVKPGSIGQPIPGVDLKLLDDDGDEVEEDDPGEITVRGPNLFSGYWPDGSGGPDRDGWWRTGDIAYADSDGDLFLVDRTRDLILVSGFNVYPREVEDAIATLPGVAEVAVIGVPHPYTGETVKALVVPEPGARVAADDVISHAAGRLARFKCPTTVELVDELPHSLIGKVAKGRLRTAEGG
jgi:long-chain acyl-CoA synthetase